MGKLRGIAGALFVAALLGGAACSSTDGAEAPGGEPPDDTTTSVADMVGSLSPGEQPLGTYYSFERFADGAGATREGSNDATVDQPIQEALSLDKVVIDASSVAATYTRVDGVRLMVGDFDAKAIGERLESIIDQEEESDTMTVTSDDDGDFRVLSLLEADPANGDGEDGAEDDERSLALMMWPSASLAVSDDRLLVLNDDVDVDVAQLIVDSADQSPLEAEGAREVTAALDDAQVYAAFISLTAVTPEGGVEALAGGFGTGFVDGDQQAYTVLAHQDEATATDNGTAVSTIMTDDANCSGDVDVQVDGALLVASCPVEEPGWPGYVSSRLGLGPFDFR